MKESNNIIDILKKTKRAIIEKDITSLKELSDRTIHTASIYQDPDNIAIAVTVYSLGKIIQKKETEKNKNWKKLAANFNLFIDGILLALKKGDMEKFRKQLEYLRKEINKLSPDFRKQVQEVFRKASINKASKIYEHGISLEQTAKMLGLTIWDISEYAAQKSETPKITATVNVKQRLKQAMDFFK